MEIERRRLIALLAASGLAPAWSARAAAAPRAPVPADAASRSAAPPADAAAERPAYLAARKRAANHEAVVLDTAGRDARVLPMPARGHSFAIDAARRRAMVFGRQPGYFALAFDLEGRAGPVALAPADGRHFFGHGVYSPDGRLLFATENDYEAGQGVLGVYDAGPGGGYRRVGEIETGGIGPHEVVLMPDGRTLCVANGGILTHPDYGKLALNPDSMRPGLAYVDIGRAALVERVEAPAELSRLSIRHLALAADGCAWFGCQYTGPAADRPPLVGRHRRGGALEFFAGPQDLRHAMRNYVGSVAADAAGAVIATSSPVGGLVAYWDAADGRCLGHTALPDGCGVAPRDGGGFLLDNGLGAIVRAGAGRPAETLRPPAPELAWDNHLRRIPDAT